MSFENYFSYVVCPANGDFELLRSIDDRIIIGSMIMEYENSFIEHYRDVNTAIKEEVERKFQATDPGECLKFLECHYDYYKFDNPNGEYFLMFIEELIPTFDMNEKRRSNIQQWIETKRNEIKNNAKPIQTEDIIENGKPDGRYKHPQQMLLLERLGIIKYLDKYNLTAEKKAVLISKIIGKDPQNTRKHLGTMVNPNNKDTCNTPKNNELIDILFNELGIS